MEVFMQNIPHAADRIELIRALEPILHGPDFHHYYIGGAPYNYNVRILGDRNGRGYNRRRFRCGKLIVPTEAIGNQVLTVMYLDPFKYHGQVITFQKSKFKARKEELALLTGPYRDPEILEEQLERKRKLQGELKIKRLWFGWPCYDSGTISIEWESPDEWELIVDDHAHRLIIKSTKNLRIVIPLRAIQSSALNLNQCTYWLERPPAFEKGKEPDITNNDNNDETINNSSEATNNSGETTNNTGEENNNGFKIDLKTFTLDFKPLDMVQLGKFMAALNLGEEREIFQRLQSLDPEQDRLFSHLRVIGIIFDDHHTTLQYERKAAVVGLKTDPDHNGYKREGFFSKDRLRQFDSMVEDLPSFGLAFQVEALLSRCRFNPKELIELEGAIWEAINEYGEKETCESLKGLDDDRDANPRIPIMDLFNRRLQHLKYRDERSRRKTRDIFHSHRLMLTPTAMVLNGPLPDETNRVLRRYIDYQSNFIRVEIRDEDGLKLHWERNVNGNAFLDERFGAILHNGFTIAGRCFEFLGYSTSALREHAMWFLSPFVTTKGESVTADLIRDSLGDFSRVNRYPARYASRIAMAFSATEPSVVMELNELDLIEDKISWDGSLFTDGVGTASPEIIEEMWELYTETRSKRNRRRIQTPSAFQIRLGGSKGMLCVDKELSGRVVRIRKSMNKFESPDRMVEICSAFDRPMAMCLNRPLIMLLETLGIPLEPIMELQEEAVQETEEAFNSLDSAARLLEKHGLGTAFIMPSLLLQLHHLQLSLSAPGSKEGLVSFLSRVLKFATNHILRDLKYKARIPVPNAWTLVGVADEYDYLKEDEIYAYVCTIEGHKEYIKGPVLISRSPTVHPGDARMVRAIGEPPADAPEALRNLTNCVVFNCKGYRSLPSMLAGGDLDGDIYSLILDQRLHPETNQLPADYTKSSDKDLGRPCTAKDISQFVIDYIKNDLLGIIAMQILFTADLSEQCMLDPDCLTLSRLHSIAVDFPKTGVPAPRVEMPKQRSDMRPDWYANEVGEFKTEFYPSERFLGHLFRAIELPAIQDAKRTAKRQRRLLEKGFDSDFQPKTVNDRFNRANSPITKLLYPQVGKYVERCLPAKLSGLISDMLDTYGWYTQEMVYICRTHSLSKWTPISEEEIVAGTIVAQCLQPRMRIDRTAAMRRESTELCASVTEAIEGPEGTSDEAQLLRAWAAWKVAVAYEEAFGSRSFGLIALKVMFDAFDSLKKKKVTEEAMDSPWCITG